MLVTADVVPSSLILVTLMMEEIGSYRTPVLTTTATRRNIPVDGILHSHSRENFKSYITFLLFKRGRQMHRFVHVTI
jgi:hypothetical protein